MIMKDLRLEQIQATLDKRRSARATYDLEESQEVRDMQYLLEEVLRLREVLLAPEPK